MSESHSHRKRVRHYDRPGDCHELTFSCFQRRQLLNDDVRMRLLSDSIERACDRHQYGLVAFVYMPEHVHLLVHAQRETSKVESFLRAVKRPFSFRVKQLLLEANSLLLKELTIRQRPGVKTFRFWQEGPGYDRNIDNGRTLEAAIDYIHLNPVRRELCERASDWLWSSASYYQDGKLRPGLPRIGGVPAGFVD